MLTACLPQGKRFLENFRNYRPRRKFRKLCAPGGVQKTAFFKFFHFFYKISIFPSTFEARETPLIKRA